MQNFLVGKKRMHRKFLNLRNLSDDHFATDYNNAHVSGGSSSAATLSPVDTTPPQTSSHVPSVCLDDAHHTAHIAENDAHIDSVPASSSTVPASGTDVVTSSLTEDTDGRDHCTTVSDEELGR
ncbi:hypothetical protein C5167_019438, partial [Papaver somniferum]